MEAALGCQALGPQWSVVAAKEGLWQKRAPGLSPVLAAEQR